MLLLVLILGMDQLLGLDLRLDLLLGLLLALLLPSLPLLLLGLVLDLEQLTLVLVLALLMAYMDHEGLGHAHERQNQALDHYSQNLDLDRSKQFDTQRIPQSQ